MKASVRERGTEREAEVHGPIDIEMKRSHDVARAKTNENGEKLKTNHNVCTLRNGSFAEESEEITIEHGESKEADDVGESTRSDENGDGNDTFVNENEVVIMKGGSKEPDENGESAEGGESGDRNVSFAKAHQNSFAKPYEDIPHNFCVEEDDGGDTFDENDTLRIARKKIEHDIEMGIPMPSLPGVSNAVQRKNKIASVVDDLAKSTSRSASAHRAHRAHVSHSMSFWVSSLSFRRADTSNLTFCIRKFQRRRTNSSRALPAGQRLAVDVKNFFGMSVDNYMGDVEFHSSKHGRYNISSRSLMHSTPQYCLQAMKVSALDNRIVLYDMTDGRISNSRMLCKASDAAPSETTAMVRFRRCQSDNLRGHHTFGTVLRCKSQPIVSPNKKCDDF